MYNDYMYAVDRSDEYLAHYGIKGMKWGVQKAKETGNARKLERHYRKTVNKLTKLSDHANREFQKERFNNAKKRMGISSGVSGAISGLYGGALASRYGLGPKQKAMLAAGAAVGGAASGALMGARGITAGRYTSDKGHQKAVQKYNEFQKEANKTFKGTKYAGKVNPRPLASKDEIKAARSTYNAQLIGGLPYAALASSANSGGTTKLNNRIKKLKGLDRYREFARYY